MCFLVLALFQFGLALNYFLEANHLANEGARYAAVLGNGAPYCGGTIQSCILSQASSQLRTGSGAVKAPATATVCFPNGTHNIGDPVKVIVSAPYQWIPFIGGGTTTIKGSATMRLEQVPTYAGGACP